MNLEVFRELDTVWIRDTDTDDEWPLPADVWDAIGSIRDAWQTPLCALRDCTNPRDGGEIEFSVVGGPVRLPICQLHHYLLRSGMWRLTMDRKGRVSPEPIPARAANAD